MITKSDCAVNEGTASFMEYKCINASFPEMAGQALFQRATSPNGENLPSYACPAPPVACNPFQLLTSCKHDNKPSGCCSVPEMCYAWRALRIDSHANHPRVDKLGWMMQWLSADANAGRAT